MEPTRQYQVALDYMVERQASGPTKGLIELTEPGSGDTIYAFCHSFNQDTGRETLLGARCSSTPSTTAIGDNGEVCEQPNLNFEVPHDVVRGAVLHVMAVPGYSEVQQWKPVYGWLVASLVFLALLFFYYGCIA